MAENYDLIFGQSASQQYAWSDSDYQNGWQTVGSTPPTAEQFDALQRRSDMKAQDLNNRLSPIEEKSEVDGRQAATSYTAGAMVTVDGLPNGWLLQCIVPGISGTDAITLPDTLIDGLTIIDGDVTWALRKVATNGGLGYRQPSTTYAVGNIAYHASLPTGYYLECTTQGTTSAGEITPSSTIGDTVSDGTVVWTVLSKKINMRLLTRNVGVADLDLLRDIGIYRIDTNTLNRPNDVNYGVVMVSPVAIGIPAVAQTLYTDTGKTYYRYNPQGSRGTWHQQEAIVAKSLGTNGYIKYASGLIMQWGKKVVSNNGSTTVDLPVSFTTTNYVALPEKIIDQSALETATRYIISVDNLTTSNFAIKTSSNLASSSSYEWFAIGY